MNIQVFCEDLDVRPPVTGESCFILVTALIKKKKHKSNYAVHFTAYNFCKLLTDWSLIYLLISSTGDQLHRTRPFVGCHTNTNLSEQWTGGGPALPPALYSDCHDKKNSLKPLEFPAHTSEHNSEGANTILFFKECFPFTFTSFLPFQKFCFVKNYILVAFWVGMLLEVRWK